MRFILSASLLLTTILSQLAVSQAEVTTEPSTSTDTLSTQADALEGDGHTMFNGQRVPPIKELGGETLAEQIKKGYTVVKFYSPMCHHCKAIAPVWQTLYEFYWTSKPLPSTVADDQQSLNDFHHYYEFDFANVNCIAFGDACKKHNIGAYPTFIIFKDGEALRTETGPDGMETLSQFIEETLEAIRPGSRVKGGPKLPEVGAKSMEGFVEPTPAPIASMKKQPTSKGKGKGTKKPKVTSTPNRTGASVSLTAESFRDLVTMTQEPWFIKFYAPWCRHCQAMAPIWTQVAKEMKGRLNVGEVNCDVETRLCKDVRLRGYPTILFFRGGERVEYSGLRGLGDFITYAQNAIEAGSGVKDIDAIEFKKMEEKEEVIFIYFYDHATTGEDFAALERLPLSLIGHAKLVKTDDPLLSERFKITTWPRLMVSRDGRPTYHTALAPKDMRDFRQVLGWMQSVWLPIVPELTASNSREIMDGKLVVLGILTRNRPDEFKAAKKELKQAALEWMDKQIQLFQLERQELRDAKQLRIEEAEDRNDQRALRHAKNIRISMDQSERKQVGFAWVDGVFWERWIRTTYGIQVSDGEKVIINDEDVSNPFPVSKNLSA
jgi:protein disulfide-isomerase